MHALSTNGVFSQLASAGAGTYHVSFESPGQFLMGYDGSVKRLTLGETPVVTPIRSSLGLTLAASPDRVGRVYLSDYSQGRLRRMNTDGTGLEDLGDPGQSGGSLYQLVVVQDSNIPLTAPLSIQSTNAFGFVAGHFGFGVSGPAGQVVVIEGSTNLVDWIPMRTNAPGTGTFHFSDPESSSLPARYYRVRTE